jgi:hypothetical protein
MYIIVTTDDFGGVCNVRACPTLDNLKRWMNKIIRGYDTLGLKCIHDMSDFDNILAYGKTRFIPKSDCSINPRNVYIKRV